MKTIRLTKLESTAYANGERRFWRAMRKQPERTMIAVFDENHTLEPYWNVGGFRLRETANNPYRCPYGVPGDQIELTYNRHGDCDTCTITAITVSQRNGKWGWVVEVGG